MVAVEGHRYALPSRRERGVYVDIALHERCQFGAAQGGGSERNRAGQGPIDLHHQRIIGEAFQVLGREVVSTDEMKLNVSISGAGGADRNETVAMKFIDGQWKFGGFIR